jgi:hypothetical protein
MLKKQIVLFVSPNKPADVWQHLAQEWQWELIHHDEMMQALGAYVMLFPSIIVIDSLSTTGQDTLSHLNDVLLDAPQPSLTLITLTEQTRAISVQKHIRRINLPRTCQTSDFIIRQLREAADLAVTALRHST